MTEREQLEQAIAALEGQRVILGDAVVSASIAALRQQLSALASAKAPISELRGERKLVTVMFADISGFTSMAETMDPEAVRDLMNACFERLVPVVEKYEGTVDKFIGDEIMALFGAPVAHEDDPIRALRAALDMIDELAAFNLHHSTDLGLHFGINTGHVIAGGIGTRGRQEYSVMGDAVNLAARLEDASERGESLVGPDTYRLTAPLFEFQTLEPIRVKGKAEPVQVYRLLAAKAVRGKVRGIEGLESALVGRDDEFGALQEAVERLQSGIGGIVTVVGEAGLGKSRLVAELRKQLSTLNFQLSTPQWVEGRCLSYGGSVAYLLWLDVLRGMLGVTADASPDAVRDALRERVQVLCPDRFDEVYPYLVRLMSLPLTGEEEDALRGLDGESLKFVTFRAVETLIESVARKQPLVIVCEDLHWADPTSIEFLDRLLTLTDRAPLLIICVFRPETEHRCWQIKETAARVYRHRHTDLWLDPLSAAESETLVGNLLHVEDLPQELGGRILSHAEGNPFYVEEIIRSLIDGGAIVRDEASGRWQAMEGVADIVLPDTLHGVLMARIDRLQEETKRVLQLASVIGRVFFYRVLAEIAREERQLDTRLLTLQREQLIRERARVPELEYIFKHHLTQEAAYNGLLKKERRAYHRQVAEALERLFPERAEELVGLLAHHWERAGETGRAVAYLRQAGEQAAAQFANAEAVSYFGRALSLTPEEDLAERYALLLAREKVYDVQGAREAQARDLAALEGLVKVLDNNRHRAELVLRQANYAVTTGDYAGGIAAARAAIEAAEMVQDGSTEAAAYLKWGWVLWRQGEYKAARSRLQQALALARAVQSGRVEGASLRSLGHVCWHLGDYPRAESYYKQALRICRETGDWRGEGTSLNNLGIVCSERGDYVGAKGYYERALYVKREIGDRQGEGMVLNNLGNVSAYQGTYAEARSHYEQALCIYREIRHRQAEGTTLANLSLLYHHLGNDKGASQYGQQALVIAKDIGDRRVQGYASTFLGHAWAGLGCLTEATAAYEQALALWRELDQPSLAMEPLAGLARVSLDQGHPESLTQAQTQVEQMLSHLETDSMLDGTEEPLRVYLTSYQVLQANGDPRAKGILETAYNLLQERATEIGDEKLRGSFLEGVASHREIVKEFTRVTGENTDD